MKIKVVYMTTISKILEVPENKVQYFNDDQSFEDMDETYKFIIPQLENCYEFIEWEKIEE